MQSNHPLNHSNQTNRSNNDLNVDSTEDLEGLLKDALIKLVSEQSKERFGKMCKNILDEFQTEFEMSMHNSQMNEGLEQMSINELQKLRMELKISVESKKDALLNQSTLRNRLMNRLIKIYELIDLNKNKMNKLFEDDNYCSNKAATDDLDDFVDRWNEDKKIIDEKFQIIDHLLNELGI